MIVAKDKTITTVLRRRVNTAGQQVQEVVPAAPSGSSLHPRWDTFNYLKVSKRVL